VQLAHEFATRRSPSHDDEGKETIPLFGGDGGVRRALEALQDAIAYLTGVVQVLEEEDDRPLELIDA
jgi:hypothetical protein